MSKPNKVELVKRQVIEHKLLTALEDGVTVAILASERDLMILIDGCASVETNPIYCSEVRSEARTLWEGLRQLRKEAFP